MGDKNSEAPENTHVFLLLGNKRKNSLAYNGKTAKDLWDFLLLLKHLKQINCFTIFQAICINQQFIDFLRLRAEM